MGRMFVTWKSEGDLPSGEEIGKVFIWDEDDPDVDPLDEWMTHEQAKALAKDLTSSLKIPAVGVLGNHDFEAGEEKEVAKILADAGVRMLDGDTYEIHGIGFAGVKP